jgi:ribonuclease-3
MEFLGDGILNFVIADELYKRRPEAKEGELSRLRASLVKGDKLAEISASLQLGDYLVLGSGELKSGGFRRASILADALEAIFGAIYLDAGFDKCRAVILSLYKDSLSNLKTSEELKDPKSRLQEWLQSRQLPLPEYEVVEVSGESHDQSFKVSCHIASTNLTLYGEAPSRQKAEQTAAKKALEQLHK